MELHAAPLSPTSPHFSGQRSAGPDDFDRRLRERHAALDGAAGTPTPAKRATGVMEAAIGSRFRIKRGAISGHWEVRDAAKVDAPSPVLLCMHPHCAGKEWANMAALHADHPSPAIMAERDEAHPILWWSDAPAPVEPIAAPFNGMPVPEASGDRPVGPVSFKPPPHGV